MPSSAGRVAVLVAGSLQCCEGIFSPGMENADSACKGLYQLRDVVHMTDDANHFHIRMQKCSQGHPELVYILSWYICAVRAPIFPHAITPPAANVSCQGSLKLGEVKQRGVRNHGNNVFINPFRDVGRENKTIQAPQRDEGIGVS